MNEKTKSTKMTNHWLITILLAFIVAAVSFFGGMKYQQSKLPVGMGRFPAGMNGQNRPNGQAVFGNGGRGGVRPVAGQVISVDDKSMTVKLQDGSTKIVLLSATTLFSKSTSGSKSDVTTGTTVSVFGTENSDGSVTAQSVQVNPLMREGTTPSATPTSRE